MCTVVDRLYVCMYRLYIVVVDRLYSPCVFSSHSLITLFSIRLNSSGDDLSSCLTRVLISKSSDNSSMNLMPVSVCLMVFVVFSSRLLIVVVSMIVYLQNRMPSWNLRRCTLSVCSSSLFRNVFRLNIC